jgi:hypothetical protein
MKIEYSNHLANAIKSNDPKPFDYCAVDHIQLDKADKYVRIDYYTTFNLNKEPFIFIIFIQTNTDDDYDELWDMAEKFGHYIGENNEQFIHIKNSLFKTIEKMISGFRDDGYWFDMYRSQYDDIYITEYPDLSEKTEDFFMDMFDDNGEIIEEKIPLFKVKATEAQRKISSHFSPN